MVKAKKCKHHGVKDPEKQREEREQKLVQLKKINNPPKEDQEMSKRFKKFIEIKNAASKIGKNNKNNKKRITVHDDFVKSEGIGKKLRNESNKQHLRRVEHLLHKKKQEAEYAKKFNVQIIRDEVTGEIKIKKDPLIKANQKKAKVSKEKESKDDEVTTSKKEEDIPEFPLVKYQLNAKQKRKLMQEENTVQDHVKFGEVVKEPPSFNLPQKTNAVKRKKNFLFLSQLSK
ncbi:DNA ligase 1 [Chironomus tepperi]|uniref:DNA ligase 1 n=1 Tax=Chironomus tepperi TaxID=113505 RepID=UPI00391FB6FC